jgi:hypothetical protein
MRALLALVALLAAAAVASAQIERLTLRQMMERVDGAVRGEIIGRQVHRVPHPEPGAGPLYYTSLVVQGTSLVDGSAATVTVSHPGGFIDGKEGVWNSEAPTLAETEVGKEVVVFYKWSADMGGGYASNALYASHGGLYTVFEARRGGKIVQGRGDGYAVPQNQRVTGLSADIERLAREIREERERKAPRGK